MKKTTAMMLILLSSTLIITSCAKKGNTGAAGTNGTNGNANVNNAGYAQVSVGTWTMPSGFKYYKADIYAPDITQEIATKGIVMIYEQNGSNWNALPYTFGVLTRDFTFTNSSVTIYYQNTDNSTTSNPGNQTYRIVTITASNMGTHPNVDVRNYSEVMNMIGSGN